ncbi:cyclic pyranopterin monophosphate synthase MoaC [Ferroplasma acidiphilum]|uniref:Cyclic pyranopterin monophosphate synthase MoaC n=1 Tax=Ferroplasma acidiphilum TaxID=74969 RepID=A0A1V0N3J1_9ARCH|nr:cyclic pyranopterin monophosphate synthase MoaC [Ferroplasma acidiphilum]ARD84661.1 molybdenum cofactor biosynthesis protein C [Ferroplasma acidiphilum]MCL4349767.1 cyclic pyranopterin monophosphate synthase MoaC [Candidatus Thermoplasmatota archaeon]NOL60542.1 cyclic pyranopterin monophosphate synthase MoaC [Ferroplasma acidiphilum]WMT53611.1 MAG: cyclic pyranopterin monophosphate synthase MoaC [Ferroplasma acidiphilum]
MIDITDKNTVKREAMATGTIKLNKETIKLIREKQVKKGDVIETAKIAGTIAVKNTSGMIPYCHPVPVMSIDFNFEVEDSKIVVTCRVKAIYRTGVEMEAINGVQVALLTIWDMVKYLEKDETGNYPDTSIGNVAVVYKRKGDAYTS